MILLMFLYINTTYSLILNNKTTIESMETQKYKSYVANQAYRYSEPPTSESVGNIFDLGWRQNWRQVMGDNPWKWFLPIANSEGDGITFAANPRVLSSIQKRANQEAQMLSNLQRQLDRPSVSEGGSRVQMGSLVPVNPEDAYNGRLSVEYRPY